MSVFFIEKGHKYIDAEKLNDFLKKWFKDSFQRNFLAYKIAECENEFIKLEEFNQIESE